MTILRAKEPFSYIDANGVPRVVSPGTLCDDSDPDVAKRLNLFEPVEVAAARASGVESATAEPGARRTRTRAKSTSATPSGDAEK